ncbi:MAG: DUF58 domain-containing protein [Kiritimatiellae bacterium]|nr:DUF58 domain-containing protein [Kiritimatiellia bacterium]MDW8459141.1 DUF58 domain-containing protein [Verrucomicrobiota bacterium]
MIPPDVIRKIRQLEIRTSRLVSDVFAGQYHSVFKGRGMEFHEVREYVPGDDVRAIDWNVTARLGHPFIKKFIEERELTVILLVDISGSVQFGSGAQFKKDLAAELAGVLAFAAIKNNDRIGLILFTDQVEHYLPPAKGPRHVLRIIRDALYFSPQRKGTSIASALHYLNRVIPRRCVAFILSDFDDDEFSRPLAAAARRHDVIAIRIEDRAEYDWLSAGVMEWVDPESGRRQLIDTSDRHVRAALSRRRQTQRSNIEKMLRSSGVDLIDLQAGQPYVGELIRFFKMRESRLAP